MQRGERLGLAGGEAEAGEAGLAAVVHLALQLLHGVPAGGDGLGRVVAGGQQHERVEHLVVEPGGGPQRVVAALDGARPGAAAEVGSSAAWRSRCAERERDVAGLVLAR